MHHDMPDANAGVTPQTATAEPTTATPVAAPAATSSSTQPNQDFMARVKAAKSPADTRKLIEELRRNPIKPGTQQPPKATEVAPATEAAPAETPAAEAPASEETSPASETPEGSETAQEGGEGQEQTAPEGSDEGDGSVETPTAKRLRIQLAEDDKVGRLTAAFLQRNRDWTLEQALEAARNKLGIKPQQATPQQAATETDTPSQPAMPATIDAVDAAIKQLRADRAKAKTELRFEDEEGLTTKIEDLIYHKFNLERQSDRQQVEAQTTYASKFQASESRAVELYPQASDANSDLGKRMVEIEQALEETGDPLFTNPDKPLIIAQMAAAELRIAPRRKGAPVTPAKPAAAPVAQTPKKGVVPSGSSRTTAPATNQPPAIVQDIQKIRSVADLRAVRAKLGLPQH